MITLDEGKVEKCNLQLGKISGDPFFPGAKIPTSCLEISLTGLSLVTKMFHCAWGRDLLIAILIQSFMHF